MFYDEQQLLQKQAEEEKERKNFCDDDDDDDDLSDAAITNIYRYKLSADIVSALHYFSKVHKHDDRKDFKAAWLIWIEENKELVRSETDRLSELNYDGDILDKMFVSARYYFRKKTNEKKEPQKRRSYIGVNAELIEAMDKHINANIVYKPSLGFDKFCIEYVDLLQKEVTVLYKNGMLDSEEIRTKIKKTYKNRHYIITQKK
jgi:hypothetical protein